MERRHKRYNGRWCVVHGLRLGKVVMTWYRACARTLLCDIRGSQTCYGRKQCGPPPIRRRYALQGGLRRREVADGVIATSGACATIASDALMNPFDGEYSTILF